MISEIYFKGKVKDEILGEKVKIKKSFNSLGNSINYIFYLILSKFEHMRY